GFEFIAQPIVPRSNSIGGLLRFVRGLRETLDLVKRVFRERRPAAVLGLGGYASGLAVRRAASRSVPAAILNPDVIPGKANQYLARRVRAICAQFEATENFLGAAQLAKLKVTGCPIRQEIRSLPARAEAAKRLGLDADRRTLVITGASQGAATINEAMVPA